MKKSLTYYLTLLMIKIKGVKKKFSTNPIDYEKLRNEDIRFPKNLYFRRNNRITTFIELNTTITEVRSRKESNKLLIFVHGGAFVYGPVQHHWNTMERISKHTNFTIWMCDYPKAPEHKISEISKNMDHVYDKAVQKFSAENIICLGDSVGGTLLITLVQRLIKNSKDLPTKLFLISPVIDSSFKNPSIDLIDLKDPILSKKGVLSAKRMCAENNDLTDPSISPISGTFENFPETVLFIAENDITFPDQQIFTKKLSESNVKNTVFIGEKMPHIWPLLPVMKEAREALDEIIALLNRE